MKIDAKPYEYNFETSKTALIVIDMQKDFCTHGGFGELLGNDLTEVIKIIPNVQRVIEFCREKGIMIIYTREGHLPDLSDCPKSKLERTRKGGAGIGDMGPMGRIMIRGEEGNSIIEELSPRDDDIEIDKPGKGAFYKTNLEDVLIEHGIENLLFTGVTTHCCVHSTIREANDRGYECLLIEDGCAAFDKKDHQAAIDMTIQQSALFGWTASVDQVLAMYE